MASFSRKCKAKTFIVSKHNFIKRLIFIRAFSVSFCLFATEAANQDSKEKVLSTAKKIIQQLPEQVQDQRTQETFIELLFNLLFTKLPKLSREEIKKMFEPLLSDVKKSRAYQEIADEGRQEKSREIAKAMLKKNFAFELISEIPGLSQQEILAISQELRDGKN